MGEEDVEGVGVFADDGVVGKGDDAGGAGRFADGTDAGTGGSSDADKAAALHKDVAGIDGRGDFGFDGAVTEESWGNGTGLTDK